MAASDPVIVVGAGLSGLSCAVYLHRAGVPVRVLEAGTEVGGRVRTDVHAGARGDYRLDRGFQIFLTAYPEARALLDYDGLDLRPFYAGADVWYGGVRHRVAHPWRHPLDAARAFLSPIATLGDKARLAELCATSRLASVASIFERPETTAHARLKEAGFTDHAVDRFFRPFFGGVFLEPDLSTSSRMFDFVYKMFLTGDAAVPARGMQEIPRQLASMLPGASVVTNCRVERVLPSREDPLVAPRTGEPERASRVVLATEGDELGRLLADRSPRSAMRWLGTTALWYSTGGPAPIDDPVLTLNGEGRPDGPVNHVAFLSNASRDYAPPGDGLACASVIGVVDGDDAALDGAARAQLGRWYPGGTDRWTLLRVDRVRRALPDARVTPGVADGGVPPTPRPPRAAPGVLVCGDHWSNGSIDGALRSGRLAAEAVLSDLRGGPDAP